MAAIIGTALTFAGVYSTGWFTRQSKDDELRVELVKIAVGILAIKKGDAAAQPRNWAIDVMELNTGVKMKEDERHRLVEEGGLQGVPLAANSPFRCALASDGRWLRFRLDPATGTNSRAEVVDASQC
jgi:hypothetical protein